MIVLIVAGLLGLYFVALSSEAVRARASARGLDLPLWLLLAASLVADAALVLLLPLPVVGRTMVPLGAAVLAAHIVAYSLDIRRGQASAPRPLVLALYLLQFPLLVAGPLVRFRDFALQQARLSTSLGAFTYGTRRITIGLIKVWAIAGILSGPVNEIFLLPPAKVGAAAAWLAAVCVSLEIYFEFSGYADIAIGLGRMLGFRYPENFRRPYTADSVREFWRRWNVTLMTWLRDYLRLPIAGRDNPSPRLYLNIVAGFCIVGLWHGGGQSVLVWAVYFQPVAGVRGDRARLGHGAAAGGGAPRVPPAGRGDWLGDVPGRDDRGRLGIPEGDGGNERSRDRNRPVLLHRVFFDDARPRAVFRRTHGAGDQPLARVARRRNGVAADDAGGDGTLRLAPCRHRPRFRAARETRPVMHSAHP